MRLRVVFPLAKNRVNSPKVVNSITLPDGEVYTASIAADSYRILPTPFCGQENSRPSGAMTLATRATDPFDQASEQERTANDYAEDGSNVCQVAEGEPAL
ncbi:MAG: hypothetical protein TQ37_06530 [Candidatus Synechococcus spongiarum 15L]|uniref:Uncharacterized protein n=1 Tax=Candidatus Synechococcus spongiarum 15L TaxID=1608419 RepID=A0A0G8AUP3_9SYNE|nr:MAG: hypothetical protein TQ37_06530 [Candidatus Synechococcus spongiarum 15L]